MSNWTKKLIRSDLIVKSKETASVFLNSIPWGKSFYYRNNQRFAARITRNDTVRTVYRNRKGINKALTVQRNKIKTQNDYMMAEQVTVARDTVRMRLIKLADYEIYPLEEYMAKADSISVKVKFLPTDRKTYNEIWKLDPTNTKFYYKLESRVINKLLEASI